MTSGSSGQTIPILKKTDKRKWRILYPPFFIILSACIVYTFVHQTSPCGKIEVRTYRVPEGWGYQILVKDKVYIDQPFIPVFQGRVAFPDRKSARRTGNLVKHKLLNHKQPTLTKDDIRSLGLENPENEN